jgi:hypothetical protein
MADTGGVNGAAARKPGVGTSVRNQSGSTIIVVMIVSIVMLVTTLAIVELAAQDAALAAREVRSSRAFYAAEAGVEKGEAWIGRQGVMPAGQIAPFGPEPEGFSGGLVLVTVTPDASGPRMVYTIRSLATVGNKSRAIEVDVTPTAFTDYIYYTNRDLGDGSPGYFRTGEVIDGPIHINDELAIWGDPVFLEEVRTTSSTVYYYNDGSPIDIHALSNAPYDEPDFQGGCALGVGHLDWLDTSDLDGIEAMADYNLNGSWDIVFGRDDGSGPMIGWVSMKRTDNTIWTDVQIPPEGLIITTGGDCHVSGVLDGQVTICGGGYVGITDDILYADSGPDGPNPGCDDILGLIGNTKVVIEDTAANQSDCVVHAHIMAINNQSSLVENYDQGSPRGTLSLYGGVAQDKWGPVGTGWYDSGGGFHLLTGYERDVHYDWRLRTMLPPGYSTFTFGTSGVDRLTWREVTPVDLMQWQFDG